MNSSTRHTFLILLLSMGMLLMLSAVPWSSLTGNVLKDFNLFEEIMDSDSPVSGGEYAQEPMPGNETPDFDLKPGPVLADSTSVDSIADAVPDSLSALTAVSDSTVSDSVALPLVALHEAAPEADGVILIENYTDRPAFSHFRKALSEAPVRKLRVAVIGDSYIEGDIFCQHLRHLLQEEYGGRGVGFMSMHTEFPGFRQTVRQSDTGWKRHDIRALAKRDSLRTLSGDYSRATGASKAKFKGSKTYPGTTGWERTSLLFIAPASGTITITAGEAEPFVAEVEASPAVQCVMLPAATDNVTISSGIPGLVALGAYLDGTTGVQLDCMSVRGNSGMPLRYLNPGLCSQMRQWVDYDLIILEFGMNAISPGQTNYTAYGQSMEDAVARVRLIYPDADILVMGVGDRGVKSGQGVKSLPAAKAMSDTQRRMARNSRVLFWDTRAAMGGDGAVADWRHRKLLNADYVHLNHAGGKELAILFFTSFQKAIDE